MTRLVADAQRGRRKEEGRREHASTDLRIWFLEEGGEGKAEERSCCSILEKSDRSRLACDNRIKEPRDV